jgi:hypothetical protein
MPTLEAYWKELKVGHQGKYKDQIGIVKEMIEGPPHMVKMDKITDPGIAHLYPWNLGEVKVLASDVGSVEQIYGRGRKQKTRGSKARKHKRRTHRRR